MPASEIVLSLMLAYITSLLTHAILSISSSGSNVEYRNSAGRRTKRRYSVFPGARESSPFDARAEIHALAVIVRKSNVSGPMGPWDGSRGRFFGRATKSGYASRER